MSGVYIKGLEMPESCLDCKVHYVWGSGRPQCLITGEFIDDRNAYKQKRLEDCPLIPVPDHGRLIDADALDTSVLQAGFSYAITHRKLRYTPGEVRQKIANAPTVIPKDKEEEQNVDQTE